MPTSGRRFTQKRYASCAAANHSAAKTAPPGAVWRRPLRDGVAMVRLQLERFQRRPWPVKFRSGLRKKSERLITVAITSLQYSLDYLFFKGNDKL